ncbi:prolyl-tRNA synthetase associated domain-containing protein [Dichotomicrobium thermohalophilum]|uniref:Ala-tRNA(Pro) hydrolase n=1 Tax=Dichotomicrobium thermohalophilum TaxID=933063 RepID=A0A397Q247_9HYPH|nr:prolyl-tRNA synthetase associated domain-containing protein [Dichotomicrobium thermohalophilum]RIA55560.1 Ala-tRNA(Pro) hydrolase [Dichotomicrobium thermohalophilum]
MSATPDDLFAKLAELGIETKTHQHPPLHTVEESRALRGEIPGAHTKNLFLKDKKGVLWLITALEDTPIDLKTLHRQLGSGRLSFGKPDLMREILGVEPGSVTPFTLINDSARVVNFVLDEALLAHETLNFHPLVNTATTSIARDDFLKFVTACGHEPLRLRLDDATASGLETGASG